VRKPLPGYKRKHVRCIECKQRFHYDYIPYSLSTPIIVLPCGHGLGQRFWDSVEEVRPVRVVKSKKKGSRR
jgi:hypothetical protein